LCIDVETVCKKSAKVPLRRLPSVTVHCKNHVIGPNREAAIGNRWRHLCSFHDLADLSEPAPPVYDLGTAFICISASEKCWQGARGLLSRRHLIHGNSGTALSQQSSCLPCSTQEASLLRSAYRAPAGQSTMTSSVNVQAGNASR
jgi:hypothetical protein